MGHVQYYASRGVYVPFVTKCEELLVFNPNPDLCQWHNLQYKWPTAITYIGVMCARHLCNETYKTEGKLLF